MYTCVGDWSYTSENNILCIYFSIAPLETNFQCSKLKSGASRFASKRVSFDKSHPHIVKEKFCCSVAQFCPALCDLLDCSKPGFPVPHYLPEFVQPLVQ